jgi:hypothetical protein
MGFGGISKQRETDKVATVPAASGGINAYDNLAAMPETDAITMLNWYPHPYGCTVRRGSQKWTTGIPTTPHTLMTWASATGSTKMFAAAGANWYDVSSSGVVGAAVVTTRTSDVWYWINFTNAAGSWLLAANGVDDIQVYDGAAYSTITLGGGATQWSGVNPNTIIHLCQHQGRVWAVEKNSTRGWYGTTDAVYGVFAKYDFGAYFPHGGYLDTLWTWSIDSGGGASDLLVAVGSEGDVVVYEGTDVTDPTKWKLKGVYYLGAPIAGRRYAQKLGGDLLILTSTGVVSLYTIFQSVQVQVSSDTVYSKKIQNLLSDAAEEVGTLAGWQLLLVPSFNQLIINIPSVFSIGAGQLVANTITTAWTIFSAWPATAMCLFEDSMYFATADGEVLQSWVGFKDNVLVDGTGGDTVRTAVQQAYSYFKVPALQKQVGMYQPNFLVASNVVLSSEIQYDFEVTEIVDASGGSISSSSLWGIALWGTALWYGALHVQKAWIQATGIGVAASLVMKTSSEADVTWISTDYSFKVGGVL